MAGAAAQARPDRSELPPLTEGTRGGIGLPPVATLPRIGGGRSAEIFELPDGRVLKLFLPGADRTIARREVAAVGLAVRMGIAAPRAERPEPVEGRVGFRMEKVAGETALARIRRAPLQAFAIVARLAAYHAQVHAVQVRPGMLPETHDVLAARAAWSLAGGEAITAALAALADLPRGDRLCHGDLHPDNLMLAERGATAIDWSQATRGDPAADVARTALLLGYASYGRILRQYAPLRAIRHLIAWWYVKCYRRATGMPRAAIDAWRVPVAVAWLQAGSVAFAPGVDGMLRREIRRARPRNRSV